LIKTGEKWPFKYTFYEPIFLYKYLILKYLNTYMEHYLRF